MSEKTTDQGTGVSALSSMAAAGDRGPWIQTFSGHRWFVLDPRPEEVPLCDLVHALSHLCRFGGHCRVFYSVLEHSVRVAREVMRKYPGELLAPLHEHAAWHDASEGLLVDLPRPIKDVMGDYRALEKVTQAVIVQSLGLGPLTGHEAEIVKRADDALLATERRDLMAKCAWEWSLTAGPLEEVIVPWTAGRARWEFLNLLRELGALPAELERGMEV